MEDKVTKKCKKCNYDNQKDSKYCEDCGNNLIETKTTKKSKRSYIIGGIISAIGFLGLLNYDETEDILFGVFFIIFGFSLMPYIYNKITNNSDNIRLLRKIVPIIIFALFVYVNSIFNYNSNLNQEVDKEKYIEEYKAFKWPDTEITKLVPVPKSNIGKISWITSYNFVIYISETTKNDYDDYVIECSNIGFNVDYQKGDDYYYAKNESGYQLSLKYEGNNVMFISVDGPKNNSNDTSQSTSSNNSQEEQNSPSNNNAQDTTKNDQSSSNKSSQSYDIEDSLANIANTYYQNETRGNKEYFKKRVKVTATISDISVDKSVLFNTGVTIHLKETGAKYRMLCNNEDGIKGITYYNRGDSITVIGTMNTMVGSSLLMDKCEIVE